MHPQLFKRQLSESLFIKKLVDFHEFYYNLQNCCHLVNVICISTTCMLLVFFTLTVFMLVLMLEVQKGCNNVVDTCIYFSIHLSEQPPDQKDLDNQECTSVV